MSLPPPLHRWALGAALSLLLPAATHAGPSQGSITAPGGFATACASAVSSGSTYTPGLDLVAPFSFFPGQFNCQSQTFSGAGGQAGADADHLGNNGAQNSAAALVGMGEIHLQAQNQSLSSVQFAVGVAGGGWMDTMRIVDDALAGQAGIWHFEVDVDGTFSVAGGGTRVLLNAYKDKKELGKQVGGFDRGGSDPFTTDAQRASWGLARSGTRTIDDRVIFAVPFIYGQDFSWGVYATTMAGQASMGAPLGAVSTSATADFSHTMRYAGSLGVLTNGVLRTDVTMVSGSGFNWGPADGGGNTVPEPGAAVLAMSALLALAALRQRRRR